MEDFEIKLEKDGAIVIWIDPFDGKRWKECKDDGEAWDLYDKLEREGMSAVIFLNSEGMHERR